MIYPFQTSNTDEISLDVGSKVSVIDSKPSGWSWVLNEDGNTGWFPTQYLDHIDTEEAEDASEVSANLIFWVIIKPGFHAL